MTENGVRLPARIAHHHPAVKWGLMVAILAVVGLSLPRSASAASPSVQAPTGTQSGGSFTGPFTFSYYINCSGGVGYGSSYTSNLDGTNNFGFYGAADGSLLVSINGGGKLLLSSCGDPYTGDQLAASYTVSKNVAPPPTPTPTPTSTPTPPPSGGGTSSGGTGSGSNGSGQGNHLPTASPVAKSAIDTNPVPVSIGASTPTPAASTPTSINLSPNHARAQSVSTRTHAASSTLRLTALGLVLLGLIAGAYTWRGRWQTWLTHARVSLSWRLEPYWFRLKTRLLRRHGTNELRHGLSHHKYSGRLLAHHHTSYPALMFLLLVSALMVGAFGASSRAAGSSSTVSVEVTGPPPSTGASITSPVDGAAFTTDLTTVRGTCDSGLRVEVSRNSTFAGSTMCDTDGLFSLVVTLVSGSNNLAALNYDGADQPGPVTPAITVTYTAPSQPAGGKASPNPSPTPPGAMSGVNQRLKTQTSSTPVQPLLVTVERHYYANLTASSSFSWPVTVGGGAAPYRLGIDWGDQKTDTMMVPAATTVTPSHTYASSGTFNVSFTTTDASGRRAVLNVIAVVTGAVIAPGVTNSHDNGTMVFAWPALAAATLIAVSFWLGERDLVHRWRLHAVPAAS